jgi:hypothetical protein
MRRSSDGVLDYVTALLLLVAPDVFGFASGGPEQSFLN